MTEIKKKIPSLRFPEFSGEWEEKKLGEIAEKPMYGLNTPATNYDGINGYIRITDIDESSNRFIKQNITSPLKFEAVYQLSEGDLLFARTGASVGKSYLYQINDGKLYFAGFLIKFKIKDAIPYFVFCQTLTDNYKKWIKIMSMRSGQPGINAEEYSIFKFYIPSLPEQQKIADFLSAIDERIQLLKEKKNAIETHKKGVMQQIFSQQLRFKDENGNNYPDWEEKRLGEVLYEHRTKNKRQDIPEVFSVAKHQGVINQIEHLGRSYAAEDTSNYKVVYSDDIIYTKSPTSDFPFGIIKQNKLSRTGIVSTLYAVFKPSNENIGYLLDAYFSSSVNTYNYLKPLVQKGAKNTMNIGNNDFLNGSKIFLPINEAEQQKIADVLSAIDDKISLCDQQIKQAEQYKKGLLQQMFV